MNTLETIQVPAQITEKWQEIIDSADRHISNGLFVGGVGATVPGTGLTFAKGAGQMILKRFYASQLKQVAT